MWADHLDIMLSASDHEAGEGELYHICTIFYDQAPNIPSAAFVLLQLRLEDSNRMEAAEGLRRLQQALVLGPIQVIHILQLHS